MSVNGIFILSEVEGRASELIAAIQKEFDPKLAAIPVRPHVTITGSSGVGPVIQDTNVEQLRAALGPIAASIAPLTLAFGQPHRYMATDIVVLPLDPNGPLRALHEKIVRSGLRFEPSRFTFSPHCTLSMYPAHPLSVFREMMGRRVNEPCVLRKLSVYRTYDPSRAVKMLELEFGGPTVDR